MVETFVFIEIRIATMKSQPKIHVSRAWTRMNFTPFLVHKPLRSEIA